MTRDEAEKIVMTVEVGFGNHYGITKGQYAEALLTLYSDMVAKPADEAEEAKQMIADIKLGEENICVDCGEVRVTIALNEDGLPLCSLCKAGTQPMLDSRGRPVSIGDWVASPDLSVDGGIVKVGAILGQVVEILLEEGIPTAHIGDGPLLKPWDIITLGGYIWVACLDCNAPWVKDLHRDESCPFCEGSRFEAIVPATHESIAICR